MQSVLAAQGKAHRPTCVLQRWKPQVASLVHGSAMPLPP
jgi:hypothetical protein